MPIHRRYIALLLFGMFFIPTMFQSLHQLSHHTGQCDHSEHKTCGISLAPTQHTKGLVLSHHKEICPICDFHFAINELPAMEPLLGVFSAMANPQNESATCLYQALTETANAGRAPPALSV